MAVPDFRAESRADPRAGSAAPAPAAEGEDAVSLRRRLLQRMLLAGGMIAALLGGLALFDQLAGEIPEEEQLAVAPRFTAAVPVGGKQEIRQSVTPVAPGSTPEPPPPPPSPSEASAPPAKEAAAADGVASGLRTPAGVRAATGTRVAGANHAPLVSPAAPTAPAATPTTPPPAARTDAVAAPVAAPPPPRVAARPGQAVGATAPTAVAAATPAEAVAAEPEDTGAPHRPPPVVEPVPATAATLPAPASARSLPAPPRLFSGYGLQAGVFAETRRAEELHAKLTLNGIPSTIEARVNVGPFKTRAEAEKARAKLRSLGIEGVLLPPRGASDRR